MSELDVHREWMGLLQPVGVVVSPTALASLGFVPERNVVDVQRQLNGLVEHRESRAPELPKAHVRDLVRLLVHALGWKEGDLRGPGLPQPVPDDLAVVLPNYGETLRPTWSVHDPFSSRALMLVQETARGADLDGADPDAGWHASPQAKFERLLSETKVRVGLLTNAERIRLVHTPEHQTSGHMTFPVHAMCEVAGRPILAAFDMLLRESRVFSAPEGKSLFDVLKKSRDYQNEVSNKLAEQVLHALWELLRGFQAADEHRGGKLLAAATPEERDQLYGGLLTSIMRMVFLLYAEDQGLLPKDEVWVRNYAVAGLHKRLTDDKALNPDTMDQRYGAWAALLALFRIVHNGGGHGDVRLPPRKGQLFDPDAYPFLEGRPAGSRHDPASKIEAPRVSDGCLLRVLDGLLVLDGERLSYRALDVEQIGSVYEAMMGYVVERMPGPSLAVRLHRKGIPGFVFVDVDELLAQEKRAKWCEGASGAKLTPKVAAAIEAAATPDEVFAALERRVSEATPRILPPGALVLQPGEERRRSGSHYTPRELTQPIVRTTLRPILEALGTKPTPKQILDLKVCDPAMGSGAFLVEACRQLAEQLVAAWETHGETPEIPPDEDALLHAKRLIAQRCLYGVDKNPFAVNLAKLSLWLVTLARDHPFTFVDHALRHGDSLVGLTREQIRRFHWDVGSSEPLPLLEGVAAAADTARGHREALEGMGDDDEEAKRAKLAEADAALAEARVAGDLVVAAFFSAEKPKDRAQRLVEMRHLLDRAREGDATKATETAAALRRGKHALPPFHWDLEFPEVFVARQPGFHAMMGNPPFLGGKQIPTGLSPVYSEAIKALFPRSKGAADLAAYFFRRAFGLLRANGCLGLLATNSIAETATRAVGLDVILAEGGVIYDAVTNFEWPGQASVTVSRIHISRGVPRVQRCLNHAVVADITSSLTRGQDFTAAVRLNHGIRYSEGTKLFGDAFIIEQPDLPRVEAENPGIRRYLRVFVNGDVLNGTPEADDGRWIVDFGEREREEIAGCDAMVAFLVSSITEERKNQTRQVHEHRPWLFWDKRTAFYAAARKRARVLACTIVSRFLAFVFVDPRKIFTHAIKLFDDDRSALFATLQSRVHEVWVNAASSRLGNTVRYSTSTSFDTFPLPVLTGCDAVQRIGEEYHVHRHASMATRRTGTNGIYALFHESGERHADIERLRQLHDAMDRAVLDAYGWTDIRPTCEFILDYEIDEEDWGRKKKPYRYRWPDEIRDEVLGRLLELNRQRAEEEKLAGKAGRRGREEGQVRRIERPKRVAEGSLPLFEHVDEDGGDE